MADLDAVLDKLEALNPVSIFLYGSRARSDFLEKSDYETGILFEDKNYHSRSQIAEIVAVSGMSIYPFKLNDFRAYKPDTPFQKNLYMRELIVGGKTIRGQKIIEDMKPPSIKIIDLLQQVRFDMGYGLAALIAYRNNDNRTAALTFSKSCLFSTRCHEILQLERFPLTYDEIYRLSKRLIPDEYRDLLTSAFEVRQDFAKLKPEAIFQNIAYLNQFIEPQILDVYKRQGAETTVLD
jgi:hypothetical protein